MIIRAQNITKFFGKGKKAVEILSKVSFGVEKGEMIAVTGPSGSGKSTLLSIIGLLQEPSSGCLFIKSKPVHTFSKSQRSLFRKDHMGFVFQDFALLPHLTCGQNIELPLKYDGYSRKTCLQRVRTVMDIFGIFYLENRRISEISGGEKQRVALSRALIRFPAILMADEPTGNLDPGNAEFVFRCLRSIADFFKTTVVVVTHDFYLARYAHRTFDLQSIR